MKHLVLFVTDKILIYLHKKKFLLKIEFQNSIQDWVLLPYNGPKKVLRINPGSAHKMAKHLSEILQQMLQGLYGGFDHFVKNIHLKVQQYLCEFRYNAIL